MQDTDNYQLVNAINKERKLAAIRSEILAMPAEKALDVILDSSFPATLVQSFPDQDLYFLMHHIGEEDFLPVLALASSLQWEYILDVEVWHSDRLDMVQMTNTLSLLYKADPERLLRWAVKDKTEFIEYYLFRNMEIRIREHDEDPSDFGDDFSTIDSVFYFRFPDVKENIETNESDELMIPEATDTTGASNNGYSDDKEADDEDSENIIYDDTGIMGPETTETLITNMLNTLADMDMSVFQGVLLETGSVIPAETEEEEFRLKNVRLAEKGFLPPHEAVAVYQPLKIKDLKKRPEIFIKKPFLGSDLPLPPQYLFFMLHKKSIFASALELLDKSENIKNADIALNLQSELAFLVNSVVSADKKTVRSRKELEKTVEKTCCYLSLGMEIIYFELFIKDKISYKDELNSKKDVVLTPQFGASILRNYALKDIFRCGSGAGIALKERARHWYDESHIVKLGLPLTFLGEKWLGIVGGLLLDRPLFFDNYTANNANYTGSNDNYTANNQTNNNYTTGLLYRPFASIEDIKQTSNELDAIIEIDKMVERLNPDPAFLSRKFLTWKSLFLTLWAIKRLGIESLCAGYCIPLNRFKPFFIQLLNLKGRKEAAIWDQHETCGKIGKVIRNDFLNWLCESGYAQENDKEGIIKKTGELEISSGNAVSATVSRIFDEVFDEIEEEYGSVSPKDIDPELIYHFCIKL